MFVAQYTSEQGKWGDCREDGTGRYSTKRANVALVSLIPTHPTLMTNMKFLIETLTILTILRTALAAGVIKTFDNHSPTV